MCLHMRAFFRKYLYRANARERGKTGPPGRGFSSRMASENDIMPVSEEKQARQGVGFRAAWRVGNDIMPVSEEKQARQGMGFRAAWREEK